jgi:putative oxidoreductase
MSRARRIVLAVLRVAVGVVFLGTAFQKLTRHTSTVADFRHWGLPSPSAFVYAIAIVELVCGLALVTGLATRLAALILLCDMLGAVATAGRVDGGRYILVPPILAALLLVLAARGGGGWQLLDRLDPPPDARRRLA